MKYISNICNKSALFERFFNLYCTKRGVLVDIVSTCQCSFLQLFSVLSSALISVRFRSVFETILDFNHSLTPITRQGSPSFISLLFIPLPLFVHIFPLSLCRCVAFKNCCDKVDTLDKVTSPPGLVLFLY